MYFDKALGVIIDMFRGFFGFIFHDFVLTTSSGVEITLGSVIITVTIACIIIKFLVGVAIDSLAARSEAREEASDYSTKYLNSSDTFSRKRYEQKTHSYNYLYNKKMKEKTKNRFLGRRK